MSDNAFGGATDDHEEPRQDHAEDSATQEPEIVVPDDASELLDGSLGKDPLVEQPAGDDGAFAGAVGDAMPAGVKDAQGDGDADARVASLTNDLQRLNAEYVNYRRRVERDREANRASAIGSVVESLIPVLDDIFAARQHGELEDGPFAKIAEKLQSILGKHGVEQIGAEGEPFDPAHHEAMVQMQADLPAGTTETTVVKVLQPGFKVGDRLVRAARVGVAEPTASAPEPEEQDAPKAQDPGEPRTAAEGDPDAGFHPAPGCDA